MTGRSDQPPASRYALAAMSAAFVAEKRRSRWAKSRSSVSTARLMITAATTTLASARSIIAATRCARTPSGRDARHAGSTPSR